MMVEVTAVSRHPQDSADRSTVRATEALTSQVPPTIYRAAFRQVVFQTLLRACFAVRMHADLPLAKRSPDPWPSLQKLHAWVSTRTVHNANAAPSLHRWCMNKRRQVSRGCDSRTPILRSGMPCGQEKLISKASTPLSSHLAISSSQAPLLYSCTRQAECRVGRLTCQCLGPAERTQQTAVGAQQQCGRLRFALTGFETITHRCLCCCCCCRQDPRPMLPTTQTFWLLRLCQISSDGCSTPP